MKTKFLARHAAALTLPAVLGALVLAGCGGGSDDSGVSTPVTTTPVTSTDVTTTFSGVAATGAALASAAVNITCASGTGSGTTGSTGSYSVAIANITLPCVLKAASSDGNTVLYSVTSATATSTNTQVANITPLTQLLVASLSGTEPATFFSGFGASTASSVTDSAIATAQTAVLTTLSNAGIDTTSLTSTSLVSGTLVAGSATSAYDVALEALAATLTSSGTTLATLTTTVAATTTASTTTTSTTTSGTASLPADMLLKTAATNCSALRSGTYRVVAPSAGTALAEQTGRMVFDAATLTVTDDEGDSSNWTAHATEACHFTADAGKSDIVVTQAGVLVGRFINDDGTYSINIGFPEQTHTLAELAGTWNVIGMDANDANTAYYGFTATGTRDAAGAISAASICKNETTWDVTSCTSEAANGSTRVINSAGGYDVVETTGYVSGRGFAYKAGGGELMIIEVYDRGDLNVWTKQRTNSLPTVGVVSTSWNLQMGSQLTSTSAVSISSNTIVSVDSTAKSWVRHAHSEGKTNDHDQTLFANNPRDGYTFRVAGTALADDGTTANISEFTVLGLRGMGLSAVLLPASKQFIFAPNLP